MQKVHVWSFPVKSDDRGSLCPIEYGRLPFRPKRSYFLFDSAKTRGGHAHRSEKEVFVCIKGSFTARIHDGKRMHTIRMNKPGKAVLSANMTWHEFSDFSPDAVMLAISSTPYKGSRGYIIDFEEFLRTC